MASTRSPKAASSDEELTRLLALTKDSDSVELKVSVPELEHRSAAVALGMDPLEAQIRQIFFDTPDLEVSGSGVVARARRVQGKGDDSVVKLRRVVPADQPADLRRSAGLTERCVDISGKQQTKTRKALEYFAKIAPAEQA